MSETEKEEFESNVEERKLLPQYTEGRRSYPEEDCPYPPGSGEKRIAWWDGFLDKKHQATLKAYQSVVSEDDSSTEHTGTPVSDQEHKDGESDQSGSDKD